MSSIPTASPVLVVLADVGLGARVCRTIGRAGFHPVIARSVREARRLLERGLTPCVALLGLTRESHGREALRTFLADGLSSETPVVVFSEELPDEGLRTILAALLAFVRTHCAAPPKETGDAALH